MGYAVYWEHDNQRWAGYGVPAECDYPQCTTEIDRGFAYKCEAHIVWDNADEPIELPGCELFFCRTHQDVRFHEEVKNPKPESETWERHMLTDESWGLWREDNPDKVKEMEERWTNPSSRA